MNSEFRDRVEAGRQLAERLHAYSGRGDVMVLALARGGVPVAFEVATRLRVPMDVLVVRKLGVPGRDELAMGAIGPGGIELIDDTTVGAFRVSPTQIARVVQRERSELKRREQLYRGRRPFPSLAGKTVLLIDDGIATGCTMRAAIAIVRAHGARSIVVAAPVASADTVAALRSETDDVVTVLIPDELYAIGEFYAHFEATTDEEVESLLRRAGAASDPRFASAKADES